MLNSTQSVKMADGSSQSYTVTAGEYNIASAPLYYVRSGFVNISNGKFWYAGSYGYWWSSRGNSGTQAYYLGFNASTTGPSNGYNRWHGFSLRCLSTV